MLFYRGFYVNFTRFTRVIWLLKLCMKTSFNSFGSTNHRQVLFWEGQQAKRTDPNFQIASRAGILAREDHWRDQLGRWADTQMPLLQKLTPSWASVPCCCQNHPVNGHRSQLWGWSMWERSSERPRPASSRNACCLGSLHTTACH